MEQALYYLEEGDLLRFSECMERLPSHQRTSGSRFIQVACMKKDSNFLQAVLNYCYHLPKTVDCSIVDLLICLVTDSTQHFITIVEHFGVILPEHWMGMCLVEICKVGNAALFDWLCYSSPFQFNNLAAFDDNLPLQMAARCGHLALVKSLVEECCYEKDDLRRRTIFSVCGRQHYEVLQWIVDREWLTVEDYLTGMTDLYFQALDAGTVEMMQWLDEHLAKIPLQLLYTYIREHYMDVSNIASPVQKYLKQHYPSLFCLNFNY